MALVQIEGGNAMNDEQATAILQRHGSNLFGPETLQDLMIALTTIRNGE